MSSKNPEDIFPNGNLLLQVERESMSCAEKLFDPNSIERHIKEGFLCLSSLEYDLSSVKVSDLKVFLSAHNLKTSGKKADLISRIIENISTNDIRTLVPDSYYLLTPKGKVAKEEWQEAERLAAQKERAERQQKRIAEMETYAPLIASRNFEAVIELIRTENTIFSSLDVYPEAIYRCLQDLDAFEYKNILVAVDYAILGGDLRSIIDDMAYLGYPMDEKMVWRVIVGTRSYVDILHTRIWGTKYQIHSRDGKFHCAHCESFNEKIFSVDEAKIGVTAPPFCDTCHCYVTGIKE